MIPRLWRIYHDPKISHAFANFKIAAGIDTGSHEGPPFHDGDFYKLLEAVAAVYAITREPRLDTMMDRAIAVIARCQRPDGYIHTPTLIEERYHHRGAAFGDKLNFETYNMGHLMTAACVHYRATGKTNLLNVAIRAADFLVAYYRRASPQLARNAICPSHYMGLIELYRTTGNTSYLRLAEDLIDLRGGTSDGTDDNQDRVPFRRMTTAMGHAVRANYLYAGVADLVAETGDDTLMRHLGLIWSDVTDHRLYITGGCGALYDGVSPDGTSYDPAQIQEVHQAYGRDYQLPNLTAHNETCANIGNVLWNWRMLLITGQARYADILEESLYNSVLSGVSLDGAKYFYTNPLRASRYLPFTLRWSGGRKEYISLSNCCPPNLARTVAEVADYMYCVSSDGLWLNLYGGNNLSVRLADGSPLRLNQRTAYPWDGKITLILRQVPQGQFPIHLRIPGWSRDATIAINGQPYTGMLKPGSYEALRRVWKAGDSITLNLPMPVDLIAANPLVEEARGQVAIRRGPIVYCLESPDLAPGQSVFAMSLASAAGWKPDPITIGNAPMMALDGTAEWTPSAAADTTSLYHEIDGRRQEQVPVRLIPYYAWANRGASDMTVWINYSPAP
ncbi:MAG TPA: glycoside hydrolase family 127 protein [Puia sp.]|nr:glycoside hydrolase family 127 protein [Puia sp.]